MKFLSQQPRINDGSRRIAGRKKGGGAAYGGRQIGLRIVPCPIIVVLIHNIIIRSFVYKTFFYAQLHMLRRSQRLENIGLGPGMRFQNMQEAIMHTSIDSVTP